MFRFTSILEYHSAIAAGTTTCVEAVSHFLSKINENAFLNSFLEVFADEALQRAAQLDQQDQRGRLHGVVIGIKDNICYKDHKVSAASKILEGFTSVYSATAVERLLAAGAIIIGRQNCDEFGMGSNNENSAYGPVLNPINNAHVAGGSSGGSAAAVKAGLCMAALGSDTGGSVRQPADFCGIVGLKPAYGTVSRWGLIAYASSFDQIGILANNVADAAAILEVIAGPDEYDSTVSSTQLDFTEQKAFAKARFAYFPEWVDHPSVDPEISQEIKMFITKLQASGYYVEAIQFPLTEYIVPAYYILTTAEASSNLARFDGVRFGFGVGADAKELARFYRLNRTSGFGSEVKRRIMLGTFVLSSGYHDAYFRKAQQVRRLLCDHTTLIFNDFDFIIGPTVPHTPYKLNDKTVDPLSIYMGDIFTVYANLTAVPAVTLPFFKHSSNFSFGLQIHSSPQNVVNLLRISHQLMQPQ